MRRADHAAIFVLIAGTYTPLTLMLPQRGPAMLALAWIVPADRGPLVVYPAAILSSTASAGEAKRFLDYLQSAAAARTFERFGFTTVTTAPKH